MRIKLLDGHRLDNLLLSEQRHTKWFADEDHSIASKYICCAFCWRIPFCWTRAMLKRIRKIVTGKAKFSSTNLIKYSTGQKSLPPQKFPECSGTFYETTIHKQRWSSPDHICCSSGVHMCQSPVSTRGFAYSLTLRDRIFILSSFGSFAWMKCCGERGKVQQENCEILAQLMKGIQRFMWFKSFGSFMGNDAKTGWTSSFTRWSTNNRHQPRHLEPTEEGRCQD